jgi:hypothetical protein
MIYIFGQGKNVSIIYDDSILTEQDKINGIAVETLPPKEDKDGFEAILYLDQNNKPYWDYKPKTKRSLEELVIDEIITKEQYKTLTGKDFTV